MASISLTGLVIDGALIVMLAAVLIAAWRLSRRVGEMRQGQTELADLVARLERATGQAQEAIGHLKSESETITEQLESETKRARGLVDELTLITEAGDNLASRLERQFASRRDEMREARETPPAVSRGRPELLQVLKEAR